MSGLHRLAASPPQAAQTQHPTTASAVPPGGPGRLLAAWLESLAGLAAGALAPDGGEAPLAVRLEQDFPQAKKTLRARLGEDGYREALALAGEEDPEIFAAAWLALARRRQRLGGIDAAAAAYQILSQVEGSAAREARRELDAILGRGAVGGRAEFLLGHFAEQVADPGMLGGMMVASAVFQGVRLAGLSRLLARPEAHWLTRGAGARFAASALGFTAEVPAFLFASKGIHHAIGPKQDWSPETLGREGLGLGVTLLFLKGFGAAGRKGVRSLHGASMGLPASPLLRIPAAALPQAATLAGIYLGHQAEAALGLRPQVDGATALTDSLVFLLQLHAGGKLSQALTGPKFAAELRRMELLSETLRPVPRPFGGETPLGGLRPWVAGPGPVASAGVSDWRLPPRQATHKNAGSLHMSQLGTGESSDYKFYERRLLSHLRDWLSVGPEADAAVRDRFGRMIEDIGEYYLKTPHVDLQRYFDLMHNSRLRDVLHDDGRTTTRVEQLEVAVKCFWYTMDMNPLRRGVGSHYDHLMQEAFERTLKEGTVEDFDALVRVASISRRIESLEAFLNERGWSARYAFLPVSAATPEPPPASLLDRLRRWLPSFRRPQAAPPPPEWVDRLHSLPLARDLRNAVERYLNSYDTAEAAVPFRDPEHNFILWRPQRNETRREAFTPTIAVEGLADYLKTWRSRPAYRKVLEDAIRRAASSTVPLLHFDRIFKVLATRDLPHKIAEVAAPDEFHWGRLQGYFDQRDGHPDYLAAVDRINGSIYTGFIYDRTLAEKFALLYMQTSRLLHEAEEDIRLSEYHNDARLLLERIENYGKRGDPAFKQDVLDLLKLDPSPDAKLAKQALERGQADIRTVPRAELRRIWEALPPARRLGNHPRAVFVPPAQNGSRRGEVIVAEKSTFDEADVLYLMKRRTTPTAEEARRAIENGEIDLQVLSKEELRELYVKLDPSAKEDGPVHAFYVPADRSPHGRPIIAVQALDPALSWENKIWQAITLPAQTVHEFEHHSHRGLKDLFLSEMRAWLEETHFMMYNGDLRSWREMQETSPYGFGVFLRSLVDKTYIEGPRHVSRKK
ncbi:hypothetical protein FBR05_14080 [Deltaproteobacteria bacterium PRO3]|nr:hypothetical protein [Deltaproteobacteria bacterium PRO3]